MSRQNRVIEHIARKSLWCLILTFVDNLVMNILKVTMFLGNRSDVINFFFYYYLFHHSQPPPFFLFFDLCKRFSHIIFFYMYNRHLQSILH